MAIDLPRDLVRPRGAQGHDLRGRAHARDRDQTLPRQRPVPARLRHVRAPLRPGVEDLRITLPDAERRRSRRARRCSPTRRRSTGELRGRPRRARTSWSSSRRRGPSLHAPRRHVRHRAAAGALGRPGADRLQPLELLVHELPERALRAGPGRLHVPPGADQLPAGRPASTSPAAARRSSRARSRRRWRATPASSRTARSARSRRPMAVTLRDRRVRALRDPDRERTHLRPDRPEPPGQDIDDCQPGQTGYQLGQRLSCPASRPRPGERGLRPARLPRPDDARSGARTPSASCFDSRVESASRRPGSESAMTRASGTQAAPAELADRADPARRDRRRLRVRLHEEAPVGRPLRGPGGVRVGPEPAAEVAGADRRRQRRRGDRGRAAHRRLAQPTAQADGETPCPRTDQAEAAALVTMTIEEEGLPLHEDAQFQLRPRLFLEGNFFVDTKPGQPDAPRGRRGPHLPGRPDLRTRCRSTRCSRRSSRTSARTCRRSSTSSATRSSKYGGAEGFRELFRSSPGAYKYTSMVNEALQGTAAARPLGPDPQPRQGGRGPRLATSRRCRTWSPTSAWSPARSRLSPRRSSRRSPSSPTSSTRPSRRSRI